MSKLLLCLGVFCLFLNTALCVDPKLSITDTEPTMNPKTKIINAHRDKDVTISCYVENLPVDTQVRWQRQYIDQNGNPQTEPIAQDQGVVDNTRYGIEKPTMFTWRLRIRSIPVAYEGEYICYVSIFLQIKSEQKVKVLVFVTPTLIPAQTSTDMTVKEGDVVDLLCNATGLPTPTIQWVRQGKALLPLGKEVHIGSKMTVNGIKYHHRGKYRCTASNAIGEIVRVIEVKVKFKPIVNAVRNTVLQAVGYVTELQCIVEANPDPEQDELSWYKGATSISQTSGRYRVNVIRGAFNRLTYELIINGVQEEDYGSYRCQASNDLGITSTQLRLEKTDIPQKSVKLGIVIVGGASSVKFCISTLIMTLVVTVLHYL